VGVSFLSVINVWSNKNHFQLLGVFSSRKLDLLVFSGVKSKNRSSFQNKWKQKYRKKMEYLHTHITQYVMFPNKSICLFIVNRKLKTVDT